MEGLSETYLSRDFKAKMSQCWASEKDPLAVEPLQEALKVTRTLDNG